MTDYENLEEFHKTLAQTSKYSEHNKEVLDKYCKWVRQNDTDLKESTLEKYLSRWHTLHELIDFRLDEAERKDLEDLIGDINNDELKKKYDEKYSASAKKKFVNVITSFYNKFIDRQDRGHGDIDGPMLIARLSYKKKPSNEVDPSTKPNAEQMRKIVQEPDSVRNRSILLFMFCTGARIGEIFPTSDKPEYLRWNDISFGEDDTMTVKLRKNDKKKDSNEKRRRVTTVIGKPIMKKWREKQNPDLDDPVFPKKDRRMYCPECDSKATQTNEATFDRRKYECDECGWQGKTRDCIRKKKPVSGNQIRENVVKPAVQSSDATPKDYNKEVDNTPHKLMRKSRALHLQARNWGDSPLRDFFGWSEGSRVVARYKKALNVNQKQELSENFEDADVDVDGYFLSEGLDPIDCNKCGKRNSRIWDSCIGCGNPISYQGLVSTDPDPESRVNDVKHDAKDQVIMEQADDIQEAQQKLEEAMRNQLESKNLINTKSKEQ